MELDGYMELIEISQREMVESMLRDNVFIGYIQMISNISIDEILKIKAEMERQEEEN